MKRLPVKPPVKPMLAKLSRELPEAKGLLYEPKWDGFRCIVFRDGDQVELGSRNERSMNRYFPELVESLKENLPERCVIDGEIVIASDHGLDFDALQLRIHPAASRVKKLAGEMPSSFVAFDVLAVGDRDLREEPFSQRRRLLEELGGHARAGAAAAVEDDRALAVQRIGLGWELGELDEAGSGDPAGVVLVALADVDQGDLARLMKLRHLPGGVVAVHR